MEQFNSKPGSKPSGGGKNKTKISCLHYLQLVGLYNADTYLLIDCLKQLKREFNISNPKASANKTCSLLNDYEVIF